jgi:cytochrome c oxidase accessory protein FixG
MKNPPAVANALYLSEAKIYARSASGRYTRLRTASMLALLGAYYLLPWLQWQGHPLVLFDLPARRFHLLGLTLFPQDLFLLAALLVVAALTLFLFTTLAGRLWCGYACPQTVWTEAFMWMERLAEGERHQRQKLDRAGWSAAKLARKTAKHAMWASFALFTGLTFVAYFIPARELYSDIATLSLAGWPLFWSLFYGFATWGNAGFMREQVCKYMCPYARFQSAMFDRDTLIIGYDAQRGEPRKGSVKKLAELPSARTAVAKGDCVDCTLCVQVCPVGIDIRKGLQYECIACAACVDACDSVMDHIGKPRGLVRYTSERRDQTGIFKTLRPRLLGYGLVWLAVIAGFAALLLTRSPIGLDVLRDRRQLFREMNDGRIANLYTLKIANKGDTPLDLQIAATRENGEALELSETRVHVDASSTESVVVAAMLPPQDARGVQTVHFDLRSTLDPSIHQTHDARFIGARSAP